jgi:Zn-dependent protease with chaperone function
MMKTEEKPRLNPFAFPSETDVRFTLLIVAALMLACNLFANLGLITGVLQGPSGSLPDPGSDPLSIRQGLAEWSRILTQVTIGWALPGGLVLLLLILAIVIYRGYPGRIRRKKKLRLIARRHDPQFFDAIQNLVNLSGISPTPRLEMAVETRAVDGQVFGFHKHYALRLGGGLRLLLRKSPDSFRAIIQHELAHIANGDIERTYFAEAVWIAAVIMTLPTFVAYIGFNFFYGLAEKLAGGLTEVEWTEILTRNLPTIFILLFQFGATLAIVAAIRSSLLRIREVYADWRAALWGVEVPLSNILRYRTSPSKTGWWMRLWRLHPTSQERLGLLQNPNGLFQISTELPFLVGVLSAFVLNGVIFLEIASIFIVMTGINYPAQWVSGLDDSLQHLLLYLFIAVGPLISMVILAIGFGMVYLMAGALGLEIQRETVAGMVTNRQGTMYLSLWKPAVLVAIGLQIGILITPFSLLALLPELISKAYGLVVLLNILLAIVGTACLTWMWLLYARFFSRRILGSHVGVSSPQLARRLLTLALSGLLLILYLPIVTEYLLVLSYIANQLPGEENPLQQQLSNIFFITLAAALFLYVISFGGTWLLVQIHRLVKHPRCPACQRVTSQRDAVGQLCEHCGHNLAPWLFVNQQPNPHSRRQPLESAGPG